MITMARVNGRRVDPPRLRPHECRSAATNSSVKRNLTWVSGTASQRRRRRSQSARTGRGGIRRAAHLYRGDTHNFSQEKSFHDVTSERPGSCARGCVPRRSRIVVRSEKCALQRRSTEHVPAVGAAATRQAADPPGPSTGAQCMAMEGVYVSTDDEDRRVAGHFGGKVLGLRQAELATSAARSFIRHLVEQVEATGVKSTPSSI